MRRFFRRKKFPPRVEECWNHENGRHYFVAHTDFDKFTEVKCPICGSVNVV